MPKAKKSVLLAMSGGIDSSMAAVVLRENGFHVEGVTFRMEKKSSDSSDESSNMTTQAIERAFQAAERFRIPHEVIDLSQQFQEKVLHYCLSEYQKGRTPNPCVMCNEQVKFRALLENAEQRKIHWVASGHYARTGKSNSPSSSQLFRGKDLQKDQSYFLYRIPKENLSRVIFPLGKLSKSYVRQMAIQLGFCYDQQPESQDVCISNQADQFAEILRKRFKAKSTKGWITDAAGKQLAKHEGIHRYTIGQRHGLGVALGFRAYVVSIHSQSGTVVVDRKAGLFSNGLVTGPVHWVSPIPKKKTFGAKVQIRYRHLAAKARVSFCPSGLLVFFDRPQRAVTPGQAAVFYDDDRLMAGAFIEKALP